jgi:hypothetical protein
MNAHPSSLLWNQAAYWGDFGTCGLMIENIPVKIIEIPSSDIGRFSTARMLLGDSGE